MPEGGVEIAPIAPAAGEVAGGPVVTTGRGVTWEGLAPDGLLPELPPVTPGAEAALGALAGVGWLAPVGALSAVGRLWVDGMLAPVGALSREGALAPVGALAEVGAEFACPRALLSRKTTTVRIANRPAREMSIMD